MSTAMKQKLKKLQTGTALVATRWKKLVLPSVKIHSGGWCFYRR